MEEQDAFRLQKQSGQRNGNDRRKTNIPVDKHEDRRLGRDRRCKWPIINEWCSPMKRE